MKHIGGQAVIEGVMMRSPKAWTVAVRGPNKEIFLKKKNVRELPKILKKPVLRGFIALAEALVIGIKALTFSSEKAAGEEEKLSSFAMGTTVFISFTLGILLFVLLPLYGTKLLGAVFQLIAENSLLFNLVDGVIRVLFFLIYILSMNLSSDIKRVFEYHGAEHKTVHAYEAGVELTPENIDNYSITHPRCGTSFLLIVMMLSILIFSFIPKDWPFVWKFLSRIVLLPVVAGLSYEFTKFAAKKMHNPLIRAMTAPGIWLQRLTAKEPSRDQIEVALKALEEVIEMDPAMRRNEEGNGNAA